MKDFNKNSLKARTSAAVAVALTIVIIAVFGIGLMVAQQNNLFSFSNGRTTSTSQAINQQQITSVSSGTSLKWEALVGDAIAGGTIAASVNSYQLSTCGTSSASCYAATKESSTVTSGQWGPTAQPYAPGTLLLYTSESGFYPNYLLDSNPSATSCTSCAQPNTYYYIENVGLIQAPASGTSVTTNVDAYIGGGQGQAQPTALSTTSPITFSATLAINQASRGVASGLTIYGTASNPISILSANSGTLTSSTSESGSETVYALGVACLNQTSTSLGTVSGTALTSMAGSGINTATQCSFITMTQNLEANAQATASTPATYTGYFSLQGSSSSGHTAITVIWFDNELPLQVQYKFSSPAATSFPAAGAAAGFPTGFSIVSLSGLPTGLVAQSYTLIVSGH